MRALHSHISVYNLPIRMRRSTATALLLLMLAAFLAPAALATVTTLTPACCRAAGPHHCSAMAASRSQRAQVQAQSCPYRKPLALSGSAATPPATQTVALADAHSFLGEFYSEVFVSHREPPHSQRGPPPASAVK